MSCGYKFCRSCVVSCDKNEVLPKLKGAGGGVKPFITDSKSLKLITEIIKTNN